MEATDKGTDRDADRRMDRHHTEHFPLHRHIAMVGAVERAVALAHENARVHISLFKTSWPDVDEARRRIQAAGLTERIDTRHIDALRAAGPAARAMDWKN